jgi:hypothetical protein
MCIRPLVSAPVHQWSIQRMVRFEAVAAAVTGAVTGAVSFGLFRHEVS